MNHNPEHFIQRLSAITLSNEKRLSMRQELSSYADLHAVVVPSAVAKTGTALDWFTDRRAVYAGGFAVLVLLTGSTAAFAAEGSLPGDVLYPVKVHVNEPIAVALATSPKAKAEVSTQLAERRLDEATTLAVRGKLDADTATYLETAVQKEVTTSNTAADEIAASGDVEAATAVRTQLEDRLAARADVLAAATSNSDQNEQAVHVIAAVTEHTHAIALVRASENSRASSTLAIASSKEPVSFEPIRAKARVSAFARSGATLALPGGIVEPPFVATMMAKLSNATTTATSTATTTDDDEVEDQSAEDTSTPVHNESNTFLPESIAPATAGGR